MDATFHYPPELMNLLIDTIPLLCRSKKDTLLFFKGSGIGDRFVRDLQTQVQMDRNSITKYAIVRTVLTLINEEDDTMLRERREVLKRVTEFEDFSTCWEDDRLKAQGLVSQIRQIVNVKDSFTRMRNERELERQQNIAKREEDIQDVQKRRRAIGQAKDELFALFGETNANRRGKALEGVLNKLFRVYGISIREAFTLTGDEREGIVEQVDGVIEIDAQLYFVEMKWWNKPLGASEISQHLVRIYHRPEARAIVISASGYTDPAIKLCKEALTKGKVVTLCTLNELVLLLEGQHDLKAFLRNKIEATIIEKNPFPQATGSSP